MDYPIPINGCALVKLGESLSNVETLEKQYATKTAGTVISVAEGESNDLVGRRVYFDEYKDGVQWKGDDGDYAFIKLEEIRGYE